MHGLSLFNRNQWILFPHTGLTADGLTHLDRNLLTCFLRLATVPQSVEAKSGKDQRLGTGLFREMFCHSVNDKTSFIHTNHYSGWSHGKQAVLSFRANRNVHLQQTKLFKRHLIGAANSVPCHVA